jgi:hypothetical protein
MIQMHYLALRITKIFVPLVLNIRFKSLRSEEVGFLYLLALYCGFLAYEGLLRKP